MTKATISVNEARFITTTIQEADKGIKIPRLLVGLLTIESIGGNWVVYFGKQGVWEETHIEDAIWWALENQPEWNPCVAQIGEGQWQYALHPRFRSKVYGSDQAAKAQMTKHINRGGVSVTWWAVQGYRVLVDPRTM